MRDCAVKDDRDDFHLLVGMGAKARVRGDDIVIEHAQGAKLDVCRIVILAERKQPVRFEPAKVRKVACIGTNDVNHGRFRSLELSSSFQLVRDPHRGGDHVSPWAGLTQEGAGQKP